MSTKVKKFAIIVLAIAAIVFIISSVGGEEPEDTGGLVSSGVDSPLAPISAAPIEDGEDFGSILSTVKSITIDDSIFSNPAYKALRDHPIALGTDIVGRSNPFAPIGNDSTTEAPMTPTVQTLQPGKVTSTSAELSAQVSFSTTAPVSVVFQYGTTDQFGSVTSPQTLTRSGVTLATISGLLPATVYYVQAVAVVGSTTTNGNTMSFVTMTPAGQ